MKKGMGWTVLICSTFLAHNSYAKSYANPASIDYVNTKLKELSSQLQAEINNLMVSGTGSPGPAGVAGPIGPAGAPGSLGPQGTQGNTGAQGPQGATGIQGPQGTQGNIGTQGPQGTTGTQGPQGTQGNTGAQGTTGPQGTQGATGAQGAQGATGTTTPSFTTFSVFGTSALTNTGSSFVSGNIGSATAAGITGFTQSGTDGTYTGFKDVNDSLASKGATDISAEYSALQGMTCGASLSNSTQTFTHGVYCITGAIAFSNVTLTLDAQNDPNATFVFQVGGVLDVDSTTNVVLINGAKKSNVYWSVVGATNLTTGAQFLGNIISNGAITLASGSNVQGRVLGIAAVTIATSTINPT
jgi:collagen type I/II/III/V/XI/XXIV/XXVII alpha